MRYCHFIFLLFFSMFSIFCKAQTDRQLIRKGNREFQKKNYVKAEIEFRNAIAFNPTNPQALYNLGTALLMQKKDSVAIKMLQKACKVEKTEVRKAQSFHNIGYICQSHQMYVEAIQAYKEALRYNPNDDETRYNLALCKKLLKNNPQKNKERNQNSKNKDKEKRKKDKENKDNQRDKNEKKDKKQNPKENQMSKENAEQLLNAALQDEKATQQRISKAIQQSSRRKLQKNW